MRVACPRWLIAVEIVRRRLITTTSGEAQTALVEACAQGLVRAYATTEHEQMVTITPREWGTGLIRYDDPTSNHWIRVNYDDLMLWLKSRVRSTPSRGKSGAKPKADMTALEHAFVCECEKRRGYPGDARPKGWRTQADVERWIMEWDDQISEATARRYAKHLLGPEGS
jgi:hypothetical protein